MQGKAETPPVTAIHVGIDVSKSHLDACFHPLGAHMRVSNDTDGHRRLAERLAGFDVQLVLMEPTSIYHRGIHRRLHGEGLPVALINPLRARLFAKAEGTLAKTDAIDAATLARMAESLKPAPVPPPSKQQEALQELVSARRAAVAERIALGNRREAAGDAFLKRELAARLRSLARHIERLETRIKALVQADPLIARRDRILRSIPGIGPVTAQTLHAQLHELGNITARQVAALAGLAPFARDSGTIHGKRRILGGRSDLRAALYMAALVASRRNPDMQRFYKTLVARGKAAKIALTAVARKLVILANTLVSQNREWTPSQP